MGPDPCGHEANGNGLATHGLDSFVVELLVLAQFPGVRTVGQVGGPCRSGIQAKGVGGAASKVSLCSKTSLLSATHI